MSRLNSRRDTGQPLPVQHTTPHGLVVFTVGALHVLLPVHALLEPQRQTGAAPLVSHHSPPLQQALPQQGPVVQLHDGSGAHWWPPAEPSDPVSAVPPCPPVPAPPVPAFPP
jgi:hypothetical protein